MLVSVTNVSLSVGPNSKTNIVPSAKKNCRKSSFPKLSRSSNSSIFSNSKSMKMESYIMMKISRTN